MEDPSMDRLFARLEKEGRLEEFLIDLAVLNLEEFEEEDK